jgi:GT2 family glycosyltransferase
MSEKKTKEPTANDKRGVGELHEPRRSYMAELYPAWLAANRLRASDLRRLREEAEGFGYRPVISIVLPVFDPEKEWLEQAIDSVLAQVYPEWELCICDDASTEPHVDEVLSHYERLDGRIKVKRLEENAGISGSSNAALSLAEGGFVGLMDHDDELSPDALFEVAKLLQDRRGADLVYSDEDKMDEVGTRFHPNFKPDWSPELLLSCNYISHLSVFRRSLLEEIGGFREGFEGCQDFDLLLRATEKTEEIHHIPKVLYHWRTATGSTASSDDSKSYIRERAHQALRESLQRRGLDGTVGDGFVPNRFRVSFNVRDEPKASIIIPTRDHRELLANCIESIERLTTYANYEILIVDNQSEDPETVEYLRYTPHRVLSFEEEFNFARINNFAVSHAEGDYVVFLNDDTEVISADWLEEMLGHAQRDEIGAVGARLLYPNGRIQHAGVVTGVGNPWQRGVAAHAHQHYSRQAAGHAGSLQLTRNFSAVTAACMTMSKTLFEEMGGFDEENLRVNFNDVDLCLRLRETGRRIVYTPFAELYHHESVSRGFGGGYHEEPVYMKRRWGDALNHDPYYNPNFSLGAADFNLPAGALRPDVARDGRPPTGEQDPERLPQEMEREERESYMQAQRTAMRDSLRTTLVPASPPQKPSKNGGKSKQAARPAARPPAQAGGLQPGVFFVIGQAKSGTSWVRSTLNSHPQIACLGEGKFFGRDFKTGNPSSGGKLPSMYSMFADSGDLRTWIGGAGHWIGAGGDREKFQAEMERHTKGLTKAAMDYFLQDARERTGKPLVGDKTPAHVGYMQEIHEFYPESRIIHIIRDGRDQAVSSVFHWWRESDRPVFSGQDPGILKKKEAYYEDKDRFGPEGESIFTENSLRGLARGWRRNVENAMELGPRLFGEGYFETRYEDLLLGPDDIFEQMISLLGANANREIVERCVEKNSFQSRAKNRKPGEEDQGSFFRKGISGDWKNYFTPRDKRIFDEEAGETLEKLGYELNDERDGNAAG